MASFCLPLASVSVAVFVTAHSSKPVTSMISAHTCTDPAVSATLVALVTIWIAALATVMQVAMLLIDTYYTIANLHKVIFMLTGITYMEIYSTKTFLTDTVIPFI